MNSTGKRNLLRDLRIYLNITWEDAELDKKIMGLAARGMVAIDRDGGQEYNYLQEAPPRQLLFDFVRYGRDDALEQWRINFGPELRTLAADTLVKGVGEE